MRIVKVGNHKWKGDLRISSTGIRVRRIIEAQNKKEAEVILREIAERLDPRNQKQKLKEISLEKALELYWEQVSITKTEKTRETDLLSFRLLTETVGEVMLSDVSELDLGKLYAEKEKRNLAKSTFNRRLSVIKSFFKWAHQVGLVSSNPTSCLKKVKHGVTRISRPADDWEVKKILDEVSDNLGFSLMIKFALFLGLRRAEVAQVKWEHIYFESHTLIVGGSSEFSTKSTKQKTLSIPVTLLVDLKKFKLQSQSEYLFPNKKGDTSIDPKIITRKFARLRKRLGMKNIKFHDFRATCATRLAELGLGDSAIAKQLGHSTVAMARRYSNQVDKNVLANATEQLSKAIGQL